MLLVPVGRKAEIGPWADCALSISLFDLPVGLFDLPVGPLELRVGLFDLPLGLFDLQTSAHCPRTLMKAQTTPCTALLTADYPLVCSLTGIFFKFLHAGKRL